ncbi:MAG: hypothetical protein CSB55_05555 [Candidatus Cloacimonadota bacterium]|nr:MAG: hypothetical protein CSB55_05555 [Candidatus Cloacimonadota bacterium]
MKNKKFTAALVIIIIEVIISLAIASQIPADGKIPIHWNFKGEVDGYAGKQLGIFLFPAINLLISAMMFFMPLYSVRYKKSEDRFAKLLPDFNLIMIIFFAMIHIFMLLIATGRINSEINPIFMLTGFLFMFIGNLLPKVPSNFFLGIRTPWTLSSETVWRKTHRLGGINFFASGILMILMSFGKNFNPVVNTALSVFIVIFTLIPIVFSFIWHKRENK